MSSRREPRFKTTTPVRAQVLRDNKMQEVDGLIVDMSGTGIGLTLDAPLVVGEVIRLQVDNHYVFAIVRHSSVAADQCTIGVERINEWSGPTATQPGAFAPTPSGIGCPPTPRGYLGDLTVVALRELFKTTTQDKKYARLRIAAIAGALACLALLAISLGLHFGLQNSTSATEKKDRQANAPAEQPATGELPTSPSTLQLIAAAKPSTALSTQAISGPVSMGSPVVQDEVSVSVSQQTPASTSAQLRSSPQTLPGLLSTEGKLEASIQASDQSWVVACADGKGLFAKLFTDGSRETIGFNQRAVVRVGSAGAVQITANGKAVGALGRVGQVRVIELTSDDSHFLTRGEPSDCTQTQP